MVKHQNARTRKANGAARLTGHKALILKNLSAGHANITGQ